METYEMTNFEEIVADEMFPETNNTYDSEIFPIKDRNRSAARRKKTYFKGKKRFDKLSNTKGFIPYKREPVMQGMLRKTNAFVVTNENETTHFGTDRNTVRRRLSANDKLHEFAMEGCSMNYRVSLKKLPKVGDTVCEMPNECDRNPVKKPTECVVTYVNKKHRWYEVEFADLGFKECYKGV